MNCAARSHTGKMPRALVNNREERGERSCPTRYPTGLSLLDRPCASPEGVQHRCYVSRSIPSSCAAANPIFLDYGLLLVGAIWGITTPLMRIESVDEAAQRQKEQTSKAAWPLLVHLLLRWRFTLLYIINQLGSLAYYALLGTYDLMIASPLANALAFVFTFATEAVLEKRAPHLIIVVFGECS
ncbi:hypothetical protein cyc_07563 [Cyclospora cayetanensis]|uniref:Transmembrane protein n=1 Tax=Cyclospora cayetanensis TaxID=88456 RepID=A0A1D3D2H3_9EIME|nr:hypothetical protein cyc_07563 [Cyclospora cayetanensis]